MNEVGNQVLCGGVVAEDYILQIVAAFHADAAIGLNGTIDPDRAMAEQLRCLRANEGKRLAKAPEVLKPAARPKWDPGLTAIAKTEFPAGVRVKRGPERRVKAVQVAGADRWKIP